MRTEKTLSAAVLKENGIPYTSLDFIYEKSRNFDTLTKNIVKEVSVLLKTSDVCYVVDGACSEDLAAQKLVKKYPFATVYEGVSKSACRITKSSLGGSGYMSVSAYSLIGADKVTFPLAVYDIDSALICSEVKLKLMDLVGESQKVHLYVGYRDFFVPLYEIDRFTDYDYSTVLTISDTPIEKKERFDYSDLISIVRILRSENGCPWDRAQTKKTICSTLIEECYELIDAVNLSDDEKICEETGDVLLQAAFYTLFLEEDLTYKSADVISGICKKLITRHTHVFGGDSAKSADEALSVWTKNKQVEKHYSSKSEYLNSVPHNFPAALRAEKVIKRALQSDSDLGDVNKSIGILKSLLTKGESSGFDEEDLKKLLFYVINLVKRSGSSAEELIAAATDDFISGFAAKEGVTLNHGKQGGNDNGN